MERGKIYFREQECSDTFVRLGTIYNASTPENHPAVFFTDDDFRAAMSILAICVRMYSRVSVYAFQIMNNHIHLLVGGDKEYIEVFFSFYRSRLEKYFDGLADFSSFNLGMVPVEDLSHFRNAVAYVNRNGYVVNPNVTPYSYPWGTSAFYFNPLAAKYALSAGKSLAVTKIRSLMHTRTADGLTDIRCIDGYACPLSFCDIQTAESVFQNASQYFYTLSRNVEGYRKIAKSLGESIFYSDSDLFVAAQKAANAQFGSSDLRILSADNKIHLAKHLHYEYNAGIKQIQRLLRIELDVLKALF